MTIASRINSIRQHLPESVRLIAVTKQVPTDAIREAYDAGIRDFGESKVQETAEKQSQLQDLPDINWHLIAPLASQQSRQSLRAFPVDSFSRQFKNRSATFALGGRKVMLSPSLPASQNVARSGQIRLERSRTACRPSRTQQMSAYQNSRFDDNTPTGVK